MVVSVSVSLSSPSTFSRRSFVATIVFVKTPAKLEIQTLFLLKSFLLSIFYIPSGWSLVLSTCLRMFGPSLVGGAKWAGSPTSYSLSSSSASSSSSRLPGVSIMTVGGATPESNGVL